MATDHYSQENQEMQPRHRKKAIRRLPIAPTLEKITDKSATNAVCAGIIDGTIEPAQTAKIADILVENPAYTLITRNPGKSRQYLRSIAQTPDEEAAILQTQAYECKPSEALDFLLAIKIREEIAQKSEQADLAVYNRNFDLAAHRYREAYELSHGFCNKDDVKSDSLLDLIQNPPPQPIPIFNGLIDEGTLNILVGQSKAGKSWASMQLGLCAASGRDWLGFSCTKPHRVLIVQFEISRARFSTRLIKQVDGLALDIAKIPCFFSKSCRGQGVSIDAVEEWARGYELIIVDPLYSLIGDESDQTGIKGAIAVFSRIASTGTTVLFVHHAGKGLIGDRQLIDRACGSGVIARAVDTFISIGPSKRIGVDVLEIQTRNYEQPEPMNVVFNRQKCIFEILPGEKITALTSGEKREEALPDIDLSKFFTANEWLKSYELKQKMRDAGISKRVVDECIRKLMEDNKLEKDTRGKEHQIYFRPRKEK